MGYGGTNSDGETTSAWEDMRDGGGKGTSGPKFEGGGVLSMLGNAMGGPGNAPFAGGGGGGGQNSIPNAPGTSFMTDIRDGGGLGRQGDNFEGLGVLSMLMNMATYPMRDSTSIGERLSALDEDDSAFFQQEYGGKSMRDLQQSSPETYNLLKQQYLADRY
jgi:hypothetical protein